MILLFEILQNPETDNIIKLRGLPFEAGPTEIIKFFEGRKGRFSPRARQLSNPKLVGVK